MIMMMMKRRLLARINVFVIPAVFCVLSRRKSHGDVPDLSLSLPQLRGTANIRANNVVRGRRHLAAWNAKKVSFWRLEI